MSDGNEFTRDLTERQMKKNLMLDCVISVLLLQLLLIFFR